MIRRKTVVSGAIIAGIILVIAAMWFVKKESTEKKTENSTQNEQQSQSDVSKVAPSSSTTKNTILYGDLLITEPFNLSEYRAAGVPVIIDFGADSCIPCKEMAPILVELHNELKGKAIIRFVDIWKNRNLADGYPLQVIPTQVFFDSEGKPFMPSETLQIPMTQYSTRDTKEHVFTTHEGGMTKEQLLSVLEEMGMNN